MEHYNSFIEVDGYTLIKAGVWIGAIAIASLWPRNNDSSDTDRSII